jgi:glycosyltransferase involved in cell wall biosynthesis
MAEDAWPGLVTVAIPVRNGAATIGEQLSALAAQDYAGAWELVVSDNGSTDGTRDVVESWRDRLSGLRLVDSSDVPGASHARNVALEEAWGQFVAFCDADDIVAPGWLRGLVAHSAPGVVVQGAMDEVSLNDPVVRAWIQPDGSSPAPGLYPHLGFLPFARSANLGLDRSVWKEIGGWSETMAMGEDADFSWRAQLAGFELRDAPDAVVHYRFRTELRSVMRQAYAVGRSDAELYARYRGQGFQRPRPARVAWTYGALAYRAPQAVTSRAWRGWWCRGIAYRSGRLAGSWRHRVWFP